MQQQRRRPFLLPSSWSLAVFVVAVVLVLSLAGLPCLQGQAVYSTFFTGSTPCGLTTDSSGFTYTSTCATGSIQKWDAQGVQVQSFEAALTPLLHQLASSSLIPVQPDRMAVSPSGQLWAIEFSGADGNALDISNDTDPTAVRLVDLGALGGGFGITFTPNSSNPWVVLPGHCVTFNVTYIVYGCAGQLAQISADGSLLQTIDTSAIPGLINSTIWAVSSDSEGALYVAASTAHPPYAKYAVLYYDYSLGYQPGLNITWNAYKLSTSGQLLQTFYSPTPSAVILFAPAVSPITGLVYVPDYLNNVVYVFAQNGSLLDTLIGVGIGGTAPTFALDVTASGDLIGLSSDDFSVIESAPDGTPRLQFSVVSVPLTYPYAGALSPSGDVLYVVGGSGYVVTFASDGTFIGPFGSSVIQSAAAIATDAEGSVYVADSKLLVVLKLSPAGLLLRNFTVPAVFTAFGGLRIQQQTGDIAVMVGQQNSDDVLLSSAVVALAADGSVLATLEQGENTYDGSFGDVAWSSEGFLVFDRNSTVFVQALNGSLISVFNYSAEPFLASAIVVTADDRVVVTTIFTGYTEILLFSLSGVLLSVIAPPSLELAPAGLAYCAATPDILYEFDQSNDRILTFPLPAAPSVRGDPHFVGLRGQSFQVHGIDGAVYALISEEHTAVNARFVFLSSGQCPVIAGVPLANCWSHPGSYMAAVSVQVRCDDGLLHTAVMTAGAAQTGFASVMVDGAALSVGASVSVGRSFSARRSGSHSVHVLTPSFELELESSDGFVNLLQLRPRLALSELTSHGLLGQTHSQTLHKSPLRYIEGEVDEYALPSNDLLGTEFAYSRFQQQ